MSEVTLEPTWSIIIFLTENASAMVTARGRPSGTATTNTCGGFGFGRE